LFFPQRFGEEKNKPIPTEKGKNVKLEEVNLKTKEAVDYLVLSLESGHSTGLTQYPGAMAKFRNYSFGNIMLIARQRAVTCCYTSLESMNMRSCALLEASGWSVAHFLRTIQYPFEYGGRFLAA
jgi:hypothetical protein